MKILSGSVGSPYWRYLGDDRRGAMHRVEPAGAAGSDRENQSRESRSIARADRSPAQRGEAVFVSPAEMTLRWAPFLAQHIYQEWMWTGASADPRRVADAYRRAGHPAPANLDLVAAA